MNRYRAISALTGGLFLLPFVAFAQNLSNVNRLVDAVGDIIETILPIMVTIALLVFFWGLIKYIMSAGDPEAAKTGKSIMIYGVIALFVMISVWGIVQFIGEALNIRQGGSVRPPQVTR